MKDLAPKHLVKLNFTQSFLQLLLLQQINIILRNRMIQLQDRYSTAQR